MSTNDPISASDAASARTSFTALPASELQSAPDVNEGTTKLVANEPMNEIALRAARALARKVHTGRRRRDRILGASISSEASWDMLLELYAAEGEQKVTSLTELCLASAVPSSTALRHLKLLEEAGLVYREPSPSARITLTEMGHRRLDLLFAKYLDPNMQG